MSETTVPPDSPPSPGCAPLPLAQLQALALAVRVALLDARVHCGTRLAAGEPAASVETDLQPIVERMLIPLRVALSEIPIESGLGACYVAMSVVVKEALAGDLRMAHVLASITAGRPAPREEGRR